MTSPLHRWSDLIESALAGVPDAPVRRVAVLAETASTQDAARAMAGGVPGLVVLAGRQTAARGRLGRRWLDDRGQSLAMTLALDAAAFDPARLSLAAGLASARAAGSVAAPDRLGLKWPNDLVDRATGRKLGGVLLETAGPLLLLGIGINANQRDEDWSRLGLLHAASLAQLCGSPVDRAALAAGVLVRLAEVLRLTESRAVAAWRELDTLTGTRHAFVHDGRRYEGLVESIDPTLTVVLRTAEGLVRLPALTTSTAAE